MISSIIFDFFGVIRTDAYDSWLHSYGLTKTGPYAEISELQDKGTISNDEFMARLSQMTGRAVTRAQMDERARLHHDTVSLILRLKPYYRIALLSNSPLGLVRHLLQTANIEGYFDEIIISSEVHMIKPSPEIFKLALDRLRVEPNQVVFLDDNPSHVEAAERLGIKCIRFTSAKQAEHDLIALGLRVNPKK